MAANSLTAIDTGLWCLDGNFVTWGCRGSVRMTVIRTSTGIILYSPVALSPENIEQIQNLGSVGLIIAPNLFHHLYLRACMAAFPAAPVFIPDGLIEKTGPIERATDNRHLIGGADIATCTVAGHHLAETVLFHRPTGTLITADLLYNYQAEHYPAEKLFFKSIRCYGAPAVAFYHRFAISDKRAVREALDTIASWPVRRIIMSHGRIIEHDRANEVFATAWEQILKA